MTPRSFILAGLAFAAACRGGAVAHAPPKAAPDEGLATLQTLDYRDPAAGNRIALRDRTAERDRHACEQTQDVSACVWAIGLSLADRRDDALARIRAATTVLVGKCRAPTDPACRIFDGRHVGADASAYADPAALCDRGFAAACNALAEGGPRDPILKRARRSCELGSALGCERLHGMLVSEDGEPKKLNAAEQADADAIAAKLRSAAELGCAHGYATSCSLVPDNAKRTREAAVDGCGKGYLDECTLPIDGDAIVGNFARACSLTGNSDACVGETRDALEHACQFRSAEACIALVKAYRAHAYPEPVPGRMTALVRYLCTPGPTFESDACEAVTE